MAMVHRRPVVDRCVCTGYGWPMITHLYITKGGRETDAYYS